MSQLLAVVLPLWSSFVAFVQSIDWMTIGAYLAATGGLAIVSKLWVSRGLWGAKVPGLAAAFELFEVLGFSPTALGEWVRRRSWYRKGQTETGRLRRTFPGLLLLCALGCSGASVPESLVCPIPEPSTLPDAIRKVTLPDALNLIRAVMSLASVSCGPSCPPELSEVSSAVNRVEATAKDVCDAVAVVRLVPCDLCADRLDAVASLVACDGAP